MNRTKAKELLPIIQAFAEGKEIQLKGGDEWRSWEELNFDLVIENYRIKPEPRVIYFNETNSGEYYGYSSRAFALIGIRDSDGYKFKGVKFQEVL